MLNGNAKSMTRVKATRFMGYLNNQLIMAMPGKLEHKKTQLPRSSWILGLCWVECNWVVTTVKSILSCHSPAFFEQKERDR